MAMLKIWRLNRKDMPWVSKLCILCLLCQNFRVWTCLNCDASNKFTQDQFLNVNEWGISSLDSPICPDCKKPWSSSVHTMHMFVFIQTFRLCMNLMAYQNPDWIGCCTFAAGIETHLALWPRCPSHIWGHESWAVRYVMLRLKTGW